MMTIQSDVTPSILLSNGIQSASTDEIVDDVENGVLRKLKHIFPNTYQRIKSICSPAKGGTGCYRFNYQPGS